MMPRPPQIPPGLELMTRLSGESAGDGGQAWQEQAWLEVIHKMDEVYSDLIRYEIGLEEKNARLEEAHAFIQSVLSAMSDVLVVCGRDGQVQQVNRAVLDLTGFAAEALIGRPLADLLALSPGEEANPLAALAQRPSQAVLRECEVRLRRADGGETDVVAMNCSLRTDHRGRPEGSVLIGRPVGELRRAYAQLAAAHAELKQAQQQLVQQEKMASLGRLVAGVAHELNNPISFVNGNAHVLDKYCRRMQAYLEAIHGGAPAGEREALRKDLRIDALLADFPDLIAGTLEGAERVTDIVRSLRRLSFAQPGKAEPFDLAEVARTAVLWTIKAARQAPRLDIDLPDGLLVRGHAGHLHQVVANLVQNALDAMEEAPATTAVLTVRGGRDSVGAVVLEVRDTGPGIPPAHLGAVFDPFFTTKPPGRGTGLGLWISYGLVRDHGGLLEAANHPDGGALMRLRLPAAPAESSP